MITAILIIFLTGYVCIALEHPLKIDKAASAIITGVICWAILSIGYESLLNILPTDQALKIGSVGMSSILVEKVGKISEIVLFLLCAMTIVEMIDAHDGFKVITDKIKTQNLVHLLWFVCALTFILSAMLDNLTTSIVMCAVIRKLIAKKELLWFFGGFIVISANAGGAWSPIGDVTTIMLWMGNNITSYNIITKAFFPSFFSLIVPLAMASVLYPFKPDESTFKSSPPVDTTYTGLRHQWAVLISGTLALLAVPVIKSTTHLPPYMAILFTMAIVWIYTAYIHRKDLPAVQEKMSLPMMMKKTDIASLFFFLGILLAVGALEVSGILDNMAHFLSTHFQDIYSINTLIGLLSAIVDNVPIVAATMEMYDLKELPTDDPFWLLLAYCAGTGGSILIIGSAGGVASMGILKIEFLWYLKRISLYALIGYLAGIAIFYLQHLFFV